MSERPGSLDAQPSDAVKWLVDLREHQSDVTKDVLHMALGDSVRSGKNVVITLMCVMTEVPFAMGPPLKVSNVNENALAAEERRVMRDVVGPYYKICKNRKVQVETHVERNDNRYAGLTDAAWKLGANRLYAGMKKNMFGNNLAHYDTCAVELPKYGCGLYIVHKGKIVREVGPHALPSFQSESPPQNSNTYEDNEIVPAGSNSPGRSYEVGTMLAAAITSSNASPPPPGRAKQNSTPPKSPAFATLHPELPVYSDLGSLSAEIYDSREQSSGRNSTGSGHLAAEWSSSGGEAVGGSPGVNSRSARFRQLWSTRHRQEHDGLAPSPPPTAPQHGQGPTLSARMRLHEDSTADSPRPLPPTFPNHILSSEEALVAASLAELNKKLSQQQRSSKGESHGAARPDRGRDAEIATSAQEQTLGERFANEYRPGGATTLAGPDARRFAQRDSSAGSVSSQNRSSWEVSGHRPDFPSSSNNAQSGNSEDLPIGHIVLDSVGDVQEASPELAVAHQADQPHPQQDLLDVQREFMRQEVKEQARLLKAELAQIQRLRAVAEAQGNQEQGHIYSAAEVAAACDNFSPHNLIGEGGFGWVYKGLLDHTPVAIKRLKSSEIVSTVQEFRKEVKMQASLRHPNIVILMGCCENPPCVVYELMARGSVLDCLTCKGNTTPLPWWTRFDILEDTCKGLLHLHHREPPIVHRDLKPANILLDRNLNAKVADIGLAHVMDSRKGESFAQQSRVVGTLGYMDPRFLQRGQFSTRSDVYSLGMVIWDLLGGLTAGEQERASGFNSGRSSFRSQSSSRTKSEGTSILISRQNQNQQREGICEDIEIVIEEEGDDMESVKLTELVRQLTELDPSAGQWPPEVACQLACMAVHCTQLNYKKRPDLATVVLPKLKDLREIVDSKGANLVAQSPLQWPGPTLENSSSSFNTLETFIPDDFLCPITMELMENPVMAADGFSYEEVAIQLWLQSKNSSPRTNMPLSHFDLTVNHSLRNAIKEWKERCMADHN